MLIPKHLEEISEFIETSENNVVLKIKCKCGHTQLLFMNFVNLIMQMLNPDSMK